MKKTHFWMSGIVMAVSVAITLMPVCVRADEIVIDDSVVLSLKDEESLVNELTDNDVIEGLREEGFSVDEVTDNVKNNDELAEDEIALDTLPRDENRIIENITPEGENLTGNDSDAGADKELIKQTESGNNEENKSKAFFRTSGFASPDEPSTGGFVTRMYDVVLCRQPDSQGYAQWVGKLNSGEMSASDIVLGFFFSKEYQEKHKSNEEIVTDFYAAMLNRAPDRSGYENWVQRLTVGMTPRAIARGFVGSQEFRGLCNKYGINPGTVAVTVARDERYEVTYFVYRLYQNCLGRKPDVNGQEEWCRQLIAGKSGAGVAHGFIFSREYKNRHTENEEYAEMLYRTILGRGPDASGKNYWVDQLNYYHTREHVFNGFMFSKEFAEQCTRAGISVGDRIPTDDNSTEWQYNIEILRLCNEQRISQGLGKLATREDLWRDVAMVRAKELPQLFSHTRPNGTSCGTAYDEAGIRWHMWAENIAAGYRSPQEAVDGWMGSSGHRANILSNNRLLATGYCYREGSTYGNYYCQNFMD